MRVNDNLSSREKEGKMRTFYIVVIVVLVTIAVAIVGALGFALGGFYDVAADNPDIGIVSWYVKMVRRHSIESRIGNLTPPASVSSAMIENASNYYYRTCKICHGAPDSPPDTFSQGLDPVPPDFGSPKWGIPETRKRFFFIKHGIKMTGMASFGEKVFKDDQVWAMVEFLKTLHEKAQKSKGQESTGIPQHARE
jgi:nitrate reductase NapE component